MFFLSLSLYLCTAHILMTRIYSKFNIQQHYECKCCGTFQTEQWNTCIWLIVRKVDWNCWIQLYFFPIAVKKKTYLFDVPVRVHLSRLFVRIQVWVTKCSLKIGLWSDHSKCHWTVRKLWIANNLACIYFYSSHGIIALIFRPEHIRKISTSERYHFCHFINKSIGIVVCGWA